MFGNLSLLYLYLALEWLLFGRSTHFCRAPVFQCTRLEKAQREIRGRRRALSVWEQIEWVYQVEEMPAIFTKDGEIQVKGSPHAKRNPMQQI